MANAERLARALDGARLVVHDDGSGTVYALEPGGPIRVYDADTVEPLDALEIDETQPRMLERARTIIRRDTQRRLAEAQA